MRAICDPVSRMNPTRQEPRATPEVSALAREWALFQQLFEHAPAGIVILDNEDRVVDANPAFRELFRYTLDEIKGNKLNELIVPERDQEKATAYSDRALANENLAFEAVRRRKDG
ncbi:MAG: PAS domain S-box protein, partial [Gammaproteobacteria bacterium]